MARLFYCFKGADDGPQLEEQAPTASTSAVPASLPQQACSNSSKQKRTSTTILYLKSKLGHFTSSTLFTDSTSRLQSKPGLEVKSQLDLIMSYARSPLAILVLACRHPNDAGFPSGTDAGSVHINLDPVYCNLSARKAFHLPLATSPDEADGDGAPGVLHAMERLEPFLLQDVRDHILRLASNDPSGSFTLHLASGKYPLGPACVVPSQSNGQLMDSAQIISRPNKLTATGGAITDPVPPFTPPRPWQYVVVEPFIYNARGLTQGLEGFAPPGTTASRGDKGSRGSPQRRYSKLYRMTPRRLTSNKGHPANPAVVNGISLKESAGRIQFGSGMQPAIILSFELLPKARQVMPHACAVATTTTDELWPAPPPQPRQGVLSQTALQTAAPARMAHTMVESIQSPNRAGSGYATNSHSVSMAVIATDEFYGSSSSSRQQHYQVQHQVQRSAPHLQRPLRMSCCDLHITGTRPAGPAGSSGGHDGVDSGAGKCAGYGSFSHGSLMQSVAEAFRAREGMVLAGLAHIVTAFTLNGAAVLYQNAASIFYFGFRGRARIASIRATKSTRGGSMVAAAANGAALSGAEDDSVNNENILAEVFCLEPVKLERMLNEVCKEGRVWKGIVQVPGSCHPALTSMTVAPTVGGRGCVGGGGRNAAAVPRVVAAKASVQRAPGHAAAASDSNHVKGTSTPPAPLQPPQQPEPTQPQSAQPRLLRPELQSTSIPPESPAVSLLPHVGGSDSHQEFISTEGTVAAAGDRTCSDEACSSLLNVGLCTLDVNVPEHVEAFRKMQSIVELDPLATSTWGLLMDTPDQGTQQEGTLGRDGIGAVTATDALTQQLLSSGANAQMSKGITSGPSAAGPQSSTRSTTSHAWPGQPLQRRDATYKKDVPEETAASRVQTSPCPSPGRTVLDNCGGCNGQGREQPLPAKLQPASMPSAYGASFRRSSDLVFGSDVDSFHPGNTPITNSGCSGIAPAATAAAGLVGRTASALMYSISHQQQVLAAQSIVTPRRSFSRVDLCPPVPATVTAGRGASRVVTFASTLRNTPSAVQVALQAAMASSTSVTRSRSSLAGDIVSIATSRNVSNLSQAGIVKGEETGAARRCLKQFISGAAPAGSPDCIGGLTQAVGTAGVSAPKPSAAAAPSNQHLYVDGTFSEAQSWCTSRFEKEDLLIPLQQRFHARARTASCGMRSSDNLYGPLPRASEDKSGSNGASQHPARGVITLSSDAINDAAKMELRNGLVKADATVATDPSGKGVHRIQRGRMQSAAVVRGTNKMREMKSLLGTSADSGDDGVKRHGNGDDEDEVEGDDDQHPMFEESIVNGFALGPKTAETATIGATAAAGITCWHEIFASRTIDPVTGQCAIILTQTDVTAKVEAESHIALVTETEHRLLEQIFPRHVLAYMTEEGGPWGAPTKPDSNRWRPMVRDINKLATSHDEVTLLFADIQ
ncbi:hypothetical protein Vretifemale_16910, partial [Volvox reticuliferus]